MNIISNCCIGGFLYKNEFKKEFENPFIWSAISFDSFIKLMDNYYTINYNNIMMEVNKIHGGYNLIIDNSVKVQYIHYRFNKNFKKPTVKGVNIYYCRIWKYIVEKYKQRLKRMLTNNEQPIWVMKDTFWDFTSENCKLLLEKHKDKHIILCTKDPELKCYESSNIKIILDDDPRIPNMQGANQHLAKLIYNNCFK